MPCVYFARQNDGKYKVGRTSLAPHKRLGELNLLRALDDPKRMSLVGVIESSNEKALETQMHRALADFQYHNELFELSDELVNGILAHGQEVAASADIPDTLVKLGVLRQPPARKFSKYVEISCPKCGKPMHKLWPELHESRCGWDERYTARIEYAESTRDAYQGA